MSDRRPKSDALRQRRHRARDRAGLFVVPVELGLQQVEDLIRDGLFDATEADDPILWRRKVSQAVVEALKTWSKKVSRVTKRGSELR